MPPRAHVENALTLVATCFLVWALGSWWPLLVLLNLNLPRRSRAEKQKVEMLVEA